MAAVVDLVVLDILNLHSSCCMSSGMEGSGGCNIMKVVGMAGCSRFAVAVLVLLMIGPVASQTQAQYSNAGKERSSESSCVFVPFWELI